MSSATPIGWTNRRQALPQVYGYPKDAPLSFRNVYRNMPLVRHRLLHAGVLNRICE